MCGIFCSVNDIDVDNFDNIKHRGPDSSSLKMIDDIIFGFHRLSVIGLDNESMQPFISENIILICNGEIFNYKELISGYNLEMQTTSDCEVILALYEKFGIHEMINLIDGEFAFILYDRRKRILYSGRDPTGIRPLFIGYTLKISDSIILEKLTFASEIKAISHDFQKIEQVVPGRYYIYNVDNGSIFAETFFELKIPESFIFPNEIGIIVLRKFIKKYLQNAVKKRMISDIPIGTFLSGGLDSSLITSIAYRLNPNIQCFTIGLKDSVDVIAAKRVCEFLKIPSSQHHVVSFTIDEGFNAIKDVIWALESYDVTTIRASVPQYLLSKYIKENTNVRVLLSGEGSDELFSGYIYSATAPDKMSLRIDSIRLLSELMYFDNLRTDRTTAAWGLEVRAPFLDKYLLQLIMNVDPDLNMSYMIQEKMLLRESFNSYDLPYDILYRRKEAFSDAVSSPTQSWYKSVSDVIDCIITDQEFAESDYFINKPMTKEALYYRNIYHELFGTKYNPIPHYWMPRWQTDILTDPSATALKFY